MKPIYETDADISDFCQNLALALHAGLSSGDGLTFMAEETADDGSKETLLSLVRQLDEGQTLSDALKNTGHFPVYAAGLIAAGEKTGRLEDTLRALSLHYERKYRMEERLRAALTYPSVLSILMLIVIFILLAKVLPVFNDVYASLGGRLTGIAGGLLWAGQILDRLMPVLCIFLAAAVFFLTCFSLSDRFRLHILKSWRIHRGDKGYFKKLNDAHFAQVLSLGLSSGLPIEETLDLCLQLTDVPSAIARCHNCIEKISQGFSLSDALLSSHMLPSTACRLLALADRSGTSDVAIEEIAQKLSLDAEESLEQYASRIEPALVLSASILVGAILLSVMLPLMHIMSTIG